MTQIQVDKIGTEPLEGVPNGENIYVFMDQGRDRLVVRFALIGGVAKVEEIIPQEDSIRPHLHDNMVERAMSEVSEMIGVEEVESVVFSIK